MMLLLKTRTIHGMHAPLPSLPSAYYKAQPTGVPEWGGSSRTPGTAICFNLGTLLTAGSLLPCEYEYRGMRKYSTSSGGCRLWQAAMETGLMVQKWNAFTIYHASENTKLCKVWSSLPVVQEPAVVWKRQYVLPQCIISMHFVFLALSRNEDAKADEQSIASPTGLFQKPHWYKQFHKVLTPQTSYKFSSTDKQIGEKDKAHLRLIFICVGATTVCFLWSRTSNVPSLDHTASTVMWKSAIMWPNSFCNKRSRKQDVTPWPAVQGSTTPAQLNIPVARLAD